MEDLSILFDHKATEDQKSYIGRRAAFDRDFCYGYAVNADTQGRKKHWWWDQYNKYRRLTYASNPPRINRVQRIE